MKAMTFGLDDLVAGWNSDAVNDPRIYRRLYIGPQKKEAVLRGVEVCSDLVSIESDSVAELIVYNHVERVSNLPAFWHECYRVLKTGCHMRVSGFYHRHEDSRFDPSRIRGLEEKMFYALAKDWREANAADPFEDEELLKAYEGIDFGLVSIVHAGEPHWLGKSEPARAWGHTHYGNVTRRLDVTMVKR